METNHDITIEEIYISSKHAKDTYLCEDFIIYPEGKEKNGGYLMGIIEIRATKISESEKISQTIINSLKDNYYDQINSSPDPQKLNLETVFEYALQKTNTALTEMIQIGHINLTLENLNYVIAIAKPNQEKKEIDLYFTHQGLINVHLLHKTKQNNYKVMNIVDNTPQVKEGQNEKLKIFASTLSGKIYPNDAIYISSEIFNNYIPAHKVNKIASQNDLSTSIDYFKNLINNVKNNSPLTYCSIFIKMEEKRAISETPVSQKSMNRLITTKETTEKYLTPTFALNLQENIRKLLKLFKRNKTKKHLHDPKERPKVKFGFVKYCVNMLKIIFTPIIAFFVFLFKVVTGKKKFKRKKDLTEPKTAMKSSAKKLLTLHRTNKAILVVIVVLIVALVSSIFWIKHRKVVKQEQLVYSEQVQSAKNLINNAQVNLIYKNNNKSLELIKQAEEIVKYLPQASNDQQANFSELDKQINTIKNKLLNIEKIVPQLITEIAGETPPTLDFVQKIGSTVIVSESNKVHEIDLNNKTVTATVDSSQGDIIKSLQDEENSLFITNQNKLVQYDIANNQFVDKSISWSGQETTSTTYYADRIYAINALDEQIYKYSGSGDSFGSGSAWIKDKKSAVLTQAIDLTIDGDIYVLTKTGTIYKFFTGDLQEFSSPAIEPEATDLAKIYTTPELTNLYILDPAGKRIIVIGKDGNLVKQYHFDSVDTAISDFFLEGNTIYLIAGNKVYSAEVN